MIEGGRLGAKRANGIWRRAVVEMPVIILSVLIALTLDNWNEERKEAREEVQYLEGFVADLSSDSVNLAQRISIAQRSIDSADSLLALRASGERASGESESRPDSVARWLFHVSFLDNFQVFDHTYRDLLSSGGLALIEDRSLRRQIVAYYRSIESAEFFTDFYKQEEIDYFALLKSRLPTETYLAVERDNQHPARFDVRVVQVLLRTEDELANSIAKNRSWAVQRRDMTARRLERNASLSEALRVALRDR
jgi:hypothetical protein